MFVLVVTGGAGAGKSEAGCYFAERGAVVIDADAIAKDAIEPDGPAYRDVAAAFGKHVLDPVGRVRYDALAQSAFADARATATLNGIVHPHVTAEVNRRLAALSALPMSPPVVVIEIPLLTAVPQLTRSADRVLDLEADPRVRVARLVGRGMDEADALRRLARQGSEAERAELADTVIRNDGGPGDLREALAAFWAREVEPHVA